MSVSLFGLPETDCHNCSAIDKQIRLTVATRSDKENCTACSTKAIQSRPKELLELLLILQNNVKMHIFRKPCTCLHQFQGRSDSAGLSCAKLTGGLCFNWLDSKYSMYVRHKTKKMNKLTWFYVGKIINSVWKTIYFEFFILSLFYCRMLILSIHWIILTHYL